MQSAMRRSMRRATRDFDALAAASRAAASLAAPAPSPLTPSPSPPSPLTRSPSPSLTPSTFDGSSGAGVTRVASHHSSLVARLQHRDGLRDLRGLVVHRRQDH